MAEASNLRKIGTGKDAIGLIVVGVLVIAVIAAAIWYCVANPDVMKDILKVILVIVVAVIVIAIIIAVAAFVFAVPFYALKGEQVQTNTDYDIDDVRSVEDKKDKEGPAN